MSSLDLRSLRADHSSGVRLDFLHLALKLICETSYLHLSIYRSRAESLLGLGVQADFVGKRLLMVLT